MTSKPELLVQIVTDIICPWCFVGSRRFKAFVQSDDYKTQIAPYVRLVLQIDPYILDPRLPATDFVTPERFYDRLDTTPYKAHEPPTKKLYYGSKYGSGLDAFDDKMAAACKELDMASFTWTTEGKVGATWNAHRLVWKASQLDQFQQEHNSSDGVDAALNALQVRLVDQLYTDFHCNSQDMSDNNYLADVATKFQLFPSQTDALAWLKSDDGESELAMKLQQADMNGVQSIPFYIVNDGADHMSETGSHQSFLKMMQMAVAPYI